MSTKFSILTQNTWLMPFRLSVSNDKRCGEIIELAKKLDPDIICFQEVWLGRYFQRVKEAFGHGYHYSPEKTRRFNRGGLMLLSKFPIREARMFKYPNQPHHSRIERIVSKRLEVSTLEVDGKYLDVLHTHLYRLESPENNHVAIPLAQFNIALDHVRPEYPSFIVGDLNLTPENLEDSIKGTFKMSDEHVTISPRNPYQQSGVNGVLPRHEFKLDHILYNDKLKLKSSKLIDDQPVSDHYGVFAEFTLV